jgi:hypothetical protein
VPLDTIEDSLKLHPVLSPGRMVRLTNSSISKGRPGCISFPRRKWLSKR